METSRERASGPDQHHRSALSPGARDQGPPEPERRRAGSAPAGSAAARDPAAVAAAERLIAAHGDALQATARRYAPSPEDADDALQRGLEVLLRRAPRLADGELLPWVKTVVKHEAFALWSARRRAAPPTDEQQLERAPSPAPAPDLQVESQERLRQGAEAIRGLKPQEVRCLLLRAEGYSYRQICELTGWTYTKVNRCLTEGRRSFFRRVEGIEAGEECDRLAPLLSALADGEVNASQLATLRPHLRSCLACRATLRGYRELPHRATELVPVAGTAAEEGPASVWRWVEGAVGWVQERAALAGLKAQAAVEASGAGKVAAVAASGAALAGGAVAVAPLEQGQGAAAPPEGGGIPAEALASAPVSLLPPLEAESAPKPAVARAAVEAPLPPAAFEPAVDEPRLPEPRSVPIPPGQPIPARATIPVDPSARSGAADAREGRSLDALTEPTDPWAVRPRRESPPGQDGGSEASDPTEEQLSNEQPAAEEEPQAEGHPPSP